MRQKQGLMQQYGDKMKAMETAANSRIFSGASSGKLIACMQLCIRCWRTLPFKRGRKSCPYCQGFLRTRMTVLNVH